jgi:predicted  nucleic acid-binding Zn-ribbon protein
MKKIIASVCVLGAFSATEDASCALRAAFNSMRDAGIEVGNDAVGAARQFAELSRTYGGNEAAIAAIRISGADLGMSLPRIITAETQRLAAEAQDAQVLAVWLDGQLRQSRENAETDIALLTGELDAARINADEAGIAATERAAELQTRIDSLTGELESARTRAATAEADAAYLRRHIDGLLDDMAAARNTADAAGIAATARAEALQAEIDGLLGELDAARINADEAGIAATERAEALQAEIEGLSGELEDARTNLEEIANTDSQRQILALRVALQKAHSSYDDLYDANAGIEAELSDLQSTLKTTEDELALACDDITNLERNLSDEQAKVADTEQQLGDLQAHAEVLATDLTDARAALMVEQIQIADFGILPFAVGFFVSDPVMFDLFRRAERIAKDKTLELVVKISEACGVAKTEVLGIEDFKRKIFIPQTLEQDDRAALAVISSCQPCGALVRDSGVEAFIARISSSIDILDPYEFVFPETEALFVYYRDHQDWAADRADWKDRLNGLLDMVKPAAAAVNAVQDGEFRFS